MTAARALTVPPLDQGTIVAGHDGLNRTVRWVDIMHAPAEAFVRDGDLVLSTGADLRQPGVRGFLAYLVSSYAAGLVLSPPPSAPVQQLLASLIPLADQHAFPLVLLPWEVPFADITRSLLPLLTCNAPQRTTPSSASVKADAAPEDVGLAKRTTPTPGGTVENCQLERGWFIDVLRHHPKSMMLAIDLLQPLLGYDAARKGQLVHTLDVLLQEGMNTSATARRLHLNRHSLLYRMHLIEELTGCSLKDATDRFNLEASIRVHLYRQERACLSDRRSTREPA